MFANSKSLVVLVTASILAVQAQSGSETSSAPSSTPSLSACLLQCVTSAAQSAGCSGFTDLACVCSSASFQTAAGECLQTNCTPEDVQAAQALGQQECGGTTTSGGSESTGTSTTTPTSVTLTGSSVSTTPTAPSTITTLTSSHTTTTTTSSKTSGTGTSTSTATSTNGAAGLVPFAFGGFFGILVASAGALVGAALVL